MEAFFHDLVAGHSTGLGPTCLRALLATASVPYRISTGMRNGLYAAGLLPRFRAPVPVISVGNITLGGTGKTPFVAFLCAQLVQHGRRVVILSRGYGSSGDGENDEALLLRAKLPGVPQLQGADRVELAQRAMAQYRPDVLVLDDGFQHRRLARDLDIVLIDCTEPFGYGRLFPRGLLREPIRSLRRAHLLVLSRVDLATADQRNRLWNTIVRTVGTKPHVWAEHRPVALCDAAGQAQPLATLSGKLVAAFCGIGNPTAFRRTLCRLDSRLAGMRSFPDHHRYSDKDLDSLAKWAGRLGSDLLVTTEKDLVKIGRSHLAERSLCALKIELVIRESQDELLDALDHTFRDGR